MKCRHGPSTRSGQSPFRRWTSPVRERARKSFGAARSAAKARRVNSTAQHEARDRSGLRARRPHRRNRCGLFHVGASAARTTGASLPNDCGPGMPWNGNSLFALYNANRFAAAYIRETNFSRAKFFIFRPAGGCCGLEILAMFKLPAYDPFAITVMGFGVAIVAVIALVF